MEDFEYLQALMGGEELPERITEHRDIWVLTDSGKEGLKVVNQARVLAETLGARVQVVLIPGGPLAACPEDKPMDKGIETSDLIAAGADRVHVSSGDIVLNGDAETILNGLSIYLEEAKPEFVLCADGWWGRGIVPRLAQRLGAGLATRCLEVSINEIDRTLVAVRPVYEGEYYEVMNFSPHWPQMVSLITAPLSQPYLDRYRAGETESFVLDSSVTSGVRTLGDAKPPDCPVPLSQAAIVVAGGAGLGETGFQKLDTLASRLGTALSAAGASPCRTDRCRQAQMAGAREAFELGWIERDQLVDITGHKIAPKLYLALGIYGDVMHSASIKDAKFVVAVHADPDAPIFALADLGIVANPVEVIDRLLSVL